MPSGTHDFLSHHRRKREWYFMVNLEMVYINSTYILLARTQSFTPNMTFQEARKQSLHVSKKKHFTEHLMNLCIHVTKQHMIQMSRRGKLHEKYGIRQEKERQREPYNQKLTGDVCRGCLRTKG